METPLTQHLKGFTLVELSIVLVIVGLLIGGILVGQSLIDSVETNQFIKRHTQMEVSMNLFKNKYKALPGENQTTTDFMNDYVHCRYSEGDLDANDIIGSTVNERDCVWAPLVKSGMIKLDLYNGIGSKCDPASDMWKCYPIPTDKIKKGYIQVDYGNWYIYRRTETVAHEQLGFLSNMRAAAIDKKGDDGIANRGSNLVMPDIEKITSFNCGKSGPLHGGHTLYDLDNADPQACGINMKLIVNENIFN